MAVTKCKRRNDRQSTTLGRPFCILHFAFCILHSAIFNFQFSIFNLSNPQSLIPNPYLLATLLIVAPTLLGCQQKMADQPSYKQLQACKFFADGRCERPAVPGTVARGHLQTDVARFTGRRMGKSGQPLGMVTAAVVQPPPGSPQAKKAERLQYVDFVDAFPMPMTEAVLQHGYDRFMIYCVVCHDPLGTGRGKIVERGYTAPPSYHIERLRKAPAGYLFAVISDGYGSMPAYGPQIPANDRWAIVGYLRALQASQHFAEADLPKEGVAFNSPLRLGEGQGVRVAGGSKASQTVIHPHPSPLPEGEGTDAVGGPSP